MQPRKTVTLPFTPRAWQLPLVEDKARRIVAVVHRRGGKSIGLMWRGIRRAAIIEPKKLPRVVHLLPYNVMWRRTGLWDRVAEAGAAIPGAEVFKSENAIRFPGGGVYQCGGADNPDSWRGGHADEVICDEFDDMPPKLVELVIEPMLADRAGTLVRCGTPKGNGLLEAAYKRAQITEGYSSYLLPHWKTKALSDDAIETAKREMSAEEFAQEFECSFVAPNEGSYYGALMNDALQQGRITSVPYDPALRVWTAWDLGIDDATAIWFAQITISGEWRLIDYIEDSGAALDYYVEQLMEREYRYEMHLLPHDAQVKELGSGRSRTETLASMGLLPYRIVRAHSVADGINAVRLVLPRAYFDAEKCARGIEALRKYRREWNAAGETWRVNPRHDWSSHCFTGDTKVLTRYGTHRLESLPQQGEILTPCGWMPYVNPRVTRRNAPLVEVQFSDGLSVKCTPDHAFLTVSGWKSAKNLLPGSMIQSTLTKSPSISMAASIACGQVKHICRAAGAAFTAMSGLLHSVLFQKDATSITEMETCSITGCPIWNAYLPANTFQSHGERLKDNTRQISTLATWRDSVPLIGIDLKQEGCGTAGTPRAFRRGQNGGEKPSNVTIAENLSRRLFAGMRILIGFAQPNARSLRIGSVRALSETADVWCLTVPDAECFSLANGAVVHNCADAMRYLTLGTRDTIAPPAPERIRDSWERAFERANREDVHSWRVA